MQKRTTTQQLNIVLTNNLLQIEKAELYNKDLQKTSTIDVNSFKEDCDFLCEYGIFASCISWNYERNHQTGKYKIECSRMNGDARNIVIAHLCATEGVNKEDINKILNVEGK